jgi:hypothetical protein
LPIPPTKKGGSLVHEVAEDVVQGAYAQVVKKFRDFQGQDFDSLSTWLQKFVVNYRAAWRKSVNRSKLDFKQAINDMPSKVVLRHEWEGAWQMAMRAGTAAFLGMGKHQRVRFGYAHPTTYFLAHNDPGFPLLREEAAPHRIGT